MQKLPSRPVPAPGTWAPIIPKLSGIDWLGELGAIDHKVTFQWFEENVKQYESLRYDKPWREHVSGLGKGKTALAPAAREALQRLFPPSAIACYGPNPPSRTCHYTNLVALQSKFYFVSNEPDPEGGHLSYREWLTHAGWWFS